MASFRDPEGRLVVLPDRVVRAVDGSAAGELATILQSGAVRRLVAAGRITSAERLDDGSVATLLADPDFRKAVAGIGAPIFVEHERIPFISYPYEWAPEMLHAAGVLTLDIADALLDEGLGLKDASAYNVLFRGPRPVFVDWLSVERREPLDRTWLAYGQFVRHFLLPLLAVRDCGVTLSQIFTARRDGLEPEAVYGMLGFRRLARPALTLVSIPTWLGRRKGAQATTTYARQTVASAPQATFILKAILKQIRRTLRRCGSHGRERSSWSEYMQTGLSYSAENFGEKEAFVRAALAKFAPASVLDVGCNTGHFSMEAAKTGAEVVAIDADPVVVGAVWREASEKKMNILPLMVDITRPSPALGWRNAECVSFLDRANGRFDMLFMLAVIHHMLVSERIPLDAIVDLAADMTRKHAIIEYVDPQDVMFKLIARGRDALFAYLTPQVFEASVERRFVVREALGVGTRRVYLLEKRA